MGGAVSTVETRVAWGGSESLGVANTLRQHVLNILVHVKTVSLCGWLLCGWLLNSLLFSFCLYCNSDNCTSLGNSSSTQLL